MRVALLSDVHANLEALRAVLDDVAGQGVDRLLCLGDVVGYNADPAPCLALLAQAGAACLAGNHDLAVAGLLATDDFSDTARRAVAWTRRRLDARALATLAGLPPEIVDPAGIVAVHGALTPAGGCATTYTHNEARQLACLEALRAHPSGARICAFGHTHHLAVYEARDGAVRAVEGDRVRLVADAHYLVNPGTVGEPRDGETRATYMILDGAEGVLAIRRVAYDRAAALAKTRAAGLHPRLTAERVFRAVNWRARRLGARVGAALGLG